MIVCYRVISTSTPAPAHCAPMGGLSLVMRTCTADMSANCFIRCCAMRPATCSTSFELMPISSFTMSYTMA